MKSTASKSLSASKKEIAERRRTEHNTALLTLWRGRPDKTPAASRLWSSLRRIECQASNAATAQCNGTPYNGEPYREEAEWESFCGMIAGRVAKALGGHLPDGFRFNTDPRGYALKIRGPEAGHPGFHIPPGLEKDWGGNGLLAPVINAD